MSGLNKQPESWKQWRADDNWGKGWSNHNNNNNNSSDDKSNSWARNNTGTIFLKLF